VNVTVCALSFRNDVDALVDEASEIGIVGDGESCAGSFEPFVKVAVVERRAAMAAFGETGGDAKILEKLAVVCAVHNAPERGNGLCAANFEAIGPEAVGPTHPRSARAVAGRRRMERGEREQARNSKSEMRNSKQIRNSNFELWTSDLFRIWTFEIRI